MLLGTFFKRPAEQLDYGIRLDKWLADGDSVQSATAQVDQAESGVIAPLTQVDGDMLRVWVAEGVSGASATVRVTVTTTANRIKQALFQIRVKD